MPSAYGIPSTIDSVALATSLADYRPTMTDNVYNSNQVLRTLSQKKEMINGGLSIAQPLMTGRQDAGGFYLGADVLNNTQPNFANMVEYQWQNAYEPIMLTRDEERQNSGDEHRILSLMGAKMKSSELAIADRLEQALSYPVGDANNLIDLETLVGTGTLGTISGATVTSWQSTVTASGAFATQGLSDMTTAFYAVSSGSNIDNPTVLITTKTIFQKYEQTRLPLERISNGDLTFNAGAQNLTFKGRPVIYGNYISAGLMFGLNMNYLHLAVDTLTDLITTEFREPVNQTIRVAYILWRGQLWTDNRRRMFKLTGIS